MLDYMKRISTSIDPKTLTDMFTEGLVDMFTDELIDGFQSYSPYLNRYIKIGSHDRDDKRVCDEVDKYRWNIKNRLKYDFITHMVFTHFLHKHNFPNTSTTTDTSLQEQITDLKNAINALTAQLNSKQDAIDALQQDMLTLRANHNSCQCAYNECPPVSTVTGTHESTRSSNSTSVASSNSDSAVSSNSDSAAPSNRDYESSSSTRSTVAHENDDLYTPRLRQMITAILDFYGDTLLTSPQLHNEHKLFINQFQTKNYTMDQPYILETWISEEMSTDSKFMGEIQGHHIRTFTKHTFMTLQRMFDPQHTINASLQQHRRVAFAYGFAIKLVNRLVVTHHTAGDQPTYVPIINMIVIPAQKAERPTWSSLFGQLFTKILF